MTADTYGHLFPRGEQQMALLRELAAPLAPSQRSEFLQEVARRLHGIELGDSAVARRGLNPLGKERHGRLRTVAGMMSSATSTSLPVRLSTLCATAVTLPPVARSSQ